MSMRPAEELKRILDKAGIVSGSEAWLKFLEYLALLQKWNARINLTGSTEWDVLGPLFGESIWASAFYPDRITRHLDIGSGAGFPAIPMRILAPQISLELVESRAKRAYFLERVVAELNLGGIVVHQERIEKFLGRIPAKWDCFSWKALKLNNEELRELFSHANPESLFWMFHGKELAVQDPRMAAAELEIMREEGFPGRKEWRLSIYRLKAPSSGD
jgi:16S rRNA (guanine(527)-N(7))-methyltransferase RsmG